MEIVIDTETTGFYPGWDELLQVAVIDGEGRILFDRLIKPSRRKTWPDAQRVHGISPMIVRSCRTFRAYRNELQGIFDAADVIVGYNTEFDLGFLSEQGILIPDCRHVDVMLDFAPVYGEWSEYYGDYKYQKLTTCAGYYGYQWPGNAHNALEDCRATLYCYRAMQRRTDQKASLPNAP